MMLYRNGRLLPFVLFLSLVMVISLSGCQVISVPASSTGSPVGTEKNVTPAAFTEASASTPVQTASPVGTYAVALDVNPSVELTVENGVVAKVAAYNDDAKQLLLNVDVTGLPVSDAMKKLVEALAAAGYINNTEIKPYLLISVYDAQQPNDSLAASLTDIAKSSLDSLGIKCNVGTKAVSSDIPAKAEALGVSIGRYMIFGYIAKMEGITIEQAITKYGDLKVAELMRLYDGMDELFDGGDTNGVEEPDNIPLLPPDQQTAVDAARTEYLAKIRMAEEVYLKAKTAAINDLKAQWEVLKAQYRDNEDSTVFKQAKNALSAEYKAIRLQIHNTFKQAVLDAQNEFRAAVSGLTEEQMDKLLDYEVSDRFGDDSGDYLSDDSIGDTDNDPDDKTVSPEGTDQPDDNQDAVDDGTTGQQEEDLNDNDGNSTDYNDTINNDEPNNNTDDEAMSESRDDEIHDGKANDDGNPDNANGDGGDEAHDGGED